MEDQYTRCRFCGGESETNDIRLWSSNPTPLVYCIKFDLALEPNCDDGTVCLSNGNSLIACDGNNCDF